jgi:uncharacterized protein (DUF305 family)
MTRTALIALAILGMLIAGCGTGDGPGTSSSTPAGNPVDRAFAAHMIPHHESALQMAATAGRRATSAFVKQLAANIVRTQTDEIATMRSADRRLRDAHVKRGTLGVADHMMGMDGDVASLDGARRFDAAFLRLMLPHHQGALVMARAELDKGEDPVLRTLARNIISAQQREIDQMREHLGPDAQMHDAGTMHGGEQAG